jgi:TRAP-type mannitol/chloroaromatic compound transport system permease small subunit
VSKATLVLLICLFLLVMVALKEVVKVVAVVQGRLCSRGEALLLAGGT